MPEPPETVQNAEEQKTNVNQGGEVATSSSKTVPEGIKPLFFSGPSQQIFGCVVDADVTPSNPHTLIPKEKIAEDFRNRAAVSDFHPVKKILLSYPGEEILLVYDYDFKYGENFYVCLTEEAKDLVLNPPQETEGGEEGGGGEEGEGEEAIPKTPEPKEWVCQGSDLEIMEGFVQPGRPLLKFSISRKRRFFGSPCFFSDRSAVGHPESCVEIASHEDTNFEMQRAEMDMAVQAVLDKTDSASQTEWLKPCNAAVQYTPRVIEEQDAQAVLQDPQMEQFLAKVCPRLELSLQQNEIMDPFIDDYKNLSETDFISGNQSDTNLMEYQSFTDLKFSKDKLITCIDWHPTIRGVVAVSCGESYSCDERIDLSTRLLLSPSLILIWSFSDPIHPQLFLEAPDDILCFRFSPTHPNIVAGGCINGQVVLWDLESYQERLQVNKAPEPTESRGMAANLSIFDTDPKLDHAPIVQYCALSSIEHGHSSAISDLHWIPDHIEVCTKTAHVLEGSSQGCCQLLTCSIDGTVMFWDTRPPPQKLSSQAKGPTPTPGSGRPFHYLDLVWKPFLKIPLPRSEFPGNFSATRVSIKEKQKKPIKAKESEETNGGENMAAPPTSAAATTVERTPMEGASTTYFVGTEDGEVVHGDWVPMSDAESGKSIPSRPDYHFNEHSGAVCCLERSPFFRDILLSVGGWTFNIWREGAKNDALLKSCSSSVPLTGGTWSPTRPGVFFITKLNGNVDIWDLMDRSHEPSLAQNVSSMSITAVVPWPLTSKKLMLAVGDSGGTLHILEVPWSLSHPSTNEVSTMEAFFDRELKRMEFAAERAVVRERERKALLDTRSQEQEESAPKEADNWEEQAKKDYEEYLAMENALLIELGLRDSPKEE